MNSTGDGMAALALAGGIVGYFYITHQTRQKKLEIIHQERMAAMEKGIPLPEFPPEPNPADQGSDPDKVILILGTVLSTLSIGAMIVLHMNLAAESHNMWVAPLPFTFLGVGFIAFHFLNREPGR